MHHDFFVRNFRKKKKNYECILILVIYCKKTGLLHTKISNHNIIYSSQKPTKLSYLKTQLLSHVYDIFMEFYNLSFVFTGQFLRYVVLVCTHRPFLPINLSHHEVVAAKSVKDISMASLLASIKIIFVETAIPFFL